MLELIESFEKNPNTFKINLELRNLKDLTQMVGLLHRFKHLKELSLHGNMIKFLPPLDCLTKLQYLDISNNPIKIDNSLLDRLFQISSLQHLIIDASKQQKKSLIEHLPSLQTLNGELINRSYIKHQKLQQQKLSLHGRLIEQLQKMKEIHNRLTTLIDCDQSGKEEIFKKEDQFNFIYKDIEEEMVYFYGGLEDRLSLEGVFSYCKNKLTIILDNLMVRILDQSGNQHAVKAYEEISRIKAENFDILLRNIFNLSYERHMSDELGKQDNRLRRQTLYLNQIFRMKKQISESTQEQTKIDRLTAREQEIKNGRENKYTLKTPSSKSRTPKNGGYDASFPLKKSTSKSYFQPYSKEPFSKQNTLPRPPSNIMTKSPSKMLNKSPSNVLNKSPSNVLNKSPSNVFSKSPSKMLNKSPSKTLAKPPIMLNKSQSKSKISKNDDFKQSSRTRGPRSQSNKILTLEQMISLIDQIMLEKRKYNNKNLQKKENYQTTEEFLFPFFSRKYGLKELALEWSLNTIKSIQKYCRQSLQVEVFGKILKNKLYEQYYDECRQFKTFVWSTLKREKLGEYIKQAEFRRIFLYFFSYQNKEAVDQLIKQTSFPQKINDFAYFIQSYKLAFEEKHMSKFVSLFEQIDNQANGFLNQDQCEVLYSQLLNGIDEEIMKNQEKQKMMDTFNQGLSKSGKDKFIFSQVFQMAHTIL